jgi:hypothetical protein
MEKKRLSLQELKAQYIDQEKLHQVIKQSLLLAGLFGLLYLIGQYLPIGYDWEHYFSKGVIPNIWVPWTGFIVKLLNLPLLFTITILSLGIRALRYKSSYLAVTLSFISLPTLWVLFLGNLDGIVLLGLLLLPLGAPLVLLKPQIASFALLAKFKSILVGTLWLLLSFLIWGFWPLQFFEVLGDAWSVEWVQDISLFPWGIVIALPLMWFSRGDEDLLMAAGSFATPHLFPYHFIVLMPALGRMSKSWMIVTWLLSWAPLSANWIGEIGWHMGNLVGLSFWLGIYLKLRSIKALTMKVTGDK